MTAQTLFGWALPWQTLRLHLHQPNRTCFISSQSSHPHLKTMIIIVFVLLFLVAVEHALIYSTRTYPRTGPSSRAIQIPAGWVSSSFSQPFSTSPPRLVTTFLSSSNPETFYESGIKIRALEHLLKGGSYITASEDIREFVLIYEGSDKDWLRSMLKTLQEKETALIISQAAVESKGLLRWNRF